MATIRLTTCEDSFEANLLKNKLEQEGIVCFLTNENFTNLLPNFVGLLGTGVHVMVEERDYERAVKLIENDMSKEGIKCPYCNSTEVVYSFGRNVTNKIIIVILSLLILIPFGNIKRSYFCKECGTEFKK
jgi:DNA-directed RNA polymerase subunit RPC12/RpoP